MADFVVADFVVADFAVADFAAAGFDAADFALPGFAAGGLGAAVEAPEVSSGVPPGSRRVMGSALRAAGAGHR